MRVLIAFLNKTMESDDSCVIVGSNSDRENSLMDYEISVTDFTKAIRHSHYSHQVKCLCRIPPKESLALLS